MPAIAPDDPPDPAARNHVVRFELAADTFALLRQARQTLDGEHGTNLSDDAFVAALCSAVLDGAPTTEPTGRARFQIAVTVCQRCRQGWQEGAGAQVAITPDAVDRAMCDAQHIGSIDGPAPERAYQDIPPSVARFVWRRDGGRCRIDGCRSTRGLELHHIVHRADGGTHDASNIILCCSRCHQSHHAGLLTISGTAEEFVVRRSAHVGADTHHLSSRNGSAVRSGVRADDAAASTAIPVTTAHERGASTMASIASATAHVGADGVQPQTLPISMDGSTDETRSGTQPIVRLPETTATTIPRAHVGASSRLDLAILRTQAKTALTGLGWKPAIAQTAVSAAIAAVHDPDITLERLIFESLRRCPAPKA
jgi:hypothetical protein